MKKLIQGIVDFRKKSLADYRHKYARLVHGQSPDTLFIACCDSRVVPNIFASTDPGDLFVLRNLGNLVPLFHDTHHNHSTDTSIAAAIEFSLKSLHISDIIICGHSECAAMQFFTDHCTHTDLAHVKSWLKYAIPSYERFKAISLNDMSDKQKQLQPHNLLSQLNVLQQMDHLKTYPWIEERLQQHTLRIHGWWFELATADVYQFESDQNDFSLIDADHAEKILASL